MKSLQKGGVPWLHLESAGMGRPGPKSLSRDFLKGLQKGGVSWLHLERAGMGRSAPKSLSRGIFEGSTERRRVLAAFRKGRDGDVRAQILITTHFGRVYRKEAHLERAGMGRSGSKSLSRIIFERSTERRRVLAAFRKGWDGEVQVQILITRHF